MGAVLGAGGVTSGGWSRTAVPRPVNIGRNEDPTRNGSRTGPYLAVTGLWHGSKMKSNLVEFTRMTSGAEPYLEPDFGWAGHELGPCLGEKRRQPVSTLINIGCNGLFIRQPIVNIGRNKGRLQK